MNSHLDNYIDKYNELVTIREVHQKSLNEYQSKGKNMTRRLKDSEKALKVVQEVAKHTQKTLEFRISNLVSTALSAVLPEPPEFVARFVLRRNQTECDLLIKEGDLEQKLSEGSSGGSIDIASFALRIARWSLNKNRPVFLLDEPFRNVSPDLQHKVSDMLKMISDKLGIQILMISHAVDINVAANKTFTTTKKGKKSSLLEVAMTLQKIKEAV